MSKRIVAKSFDEDYAAERMYSRWRHVNDCILEWLSLTDRLALQKRMSQATGTILDLGCGSGRLMRALLQAVRPSRTWLIGVDLSPTGLRKAKKVVGSQHASFVMCDAENLPFKQQSFDYVICIGVLDYVENVSEFLHQIVRSAKPSATIMINAINRVGVALILGRILACANPRHRASKLSFRSYSAYEIKTLISGTLLNVRVFSYRYLPTQAVRLICVLVGEHHLARHLSLLLLTKMEKLARKLPLVETFGGQALMVEIAT